MECFIFSAILILLTAFFAGRSSQRSGRTRRQQMAYRQLAQHFHGVCQRGGWFGYPSVRFRYGAASASVTTYSLGGSVRVTQVQIEWPDPSFRCEIATRDGFASTTSLDGLRPIAINVPEFNNMYVLRGTALPEIQQLLSGAVRWQIEKLRRLFGDRRVRVVIGHGGLTIQKRCEIQSFQELLEFTRLSLELYDQAMLTRAAGIEFVEELSAQLLENVTCQICGDSIEEQLVYCRRCKTPHHLDCWQYNGTCSVFACGETRFEKPVVAQVAEPAPPNPSENQELR